MKALFLISFLLSFTAAFAEPNCSGSVYLESTCGGTCTQAQCQDVSFNTDGSEFQCCVPELPKGVLSVLFVVLILGFSVYLKKRKREAKAFATV
jgi:hypothetical protein